jgi:uncharacterized protein YegP (UPF0339 family)
MGTFVITKRFNDTYKFAFNSRKGKVIFASNVFELKFECEAAIIDFINNTEKASYIKQKASNGKYFFKVLFDDFVFATSRKYTTELRMQKGISEIKDYASKSEILDFSEYNFIFDNE